MGLAKSRLTVAALPAVCLLVVSFPCGRWRIGAFDEEYISPKCNASQEESLIEYEI